MGCWVARRDAFLRIWQIQYMLYLVGPLIVKTCCCEVHERQIEKLFLGGKGDGWDGRNIQCDHVHYEMRRKE